MSGTLDLTLLESKMEAKALAQKSEEELRNEIAAGSVDPEVYCRLAEILFASGQVEESATLYERALTLPLTNLQKESVCIELGWMHYEIGQESEALRVANNSIEVLTAVPDSPQVLAYRGSSQSLRAHCLWFFDENAGADAGRLALDCFRRVIAEAPNFDGIAGVYYDVARLQNLLGNSDEAVIFCEKCLRERLSERERLQCLVVLSEALRLQERFDEAEKALKKAFDYVKADVTALPRLFLELGMLQRLTNRSQEAEHSFRQAISALESHPYSRDDPQFLTEIYGNLGEIYYESGVYEKAVTAFRRVLDHHPEDDVDRRNALRWLGQSHQGLGAYPEAENYYNQVLNSSHASASEKLSVEQGLAKICYETKSYEKAISTFRRIISSSSQDNPIYCNTLLWLGYSYQAKGLDPEASDCFEKVLASPHASENEKTSAQEGLTRLSTLKKTLH